MRIRATVAAVTGALALSAFVVPAAQAADAPSGKAAFSAATADGTASAAATLDVTFSNMKVNNGKNIVVGTTNVVSVPVTYTLTHPVGMDTSEDNFASGPLIYRGSSVTSPSNEIISDDPATCTTASSTTLNCSGTIYIRPADGDLTNADAGTWNAGGLAINSAGDTKTQGGLGATKVQRYSKLTVNAGPEPVAKGRTVTSTGKLSRANWDDNAYHGYTVQPVKLQFRKAGTSTYTTVKTVNSDSYGNVKATATAQYDGYWRFSFAGTTTTPAVNATGDYVDVK
ncbi:hypothetical protein [Streptomyces resistomycificus]|uniref:Lipoprotein n=1 Tax=Streptomyces resistomycificus TaxID=67356 RepID=A0A0L8L773_9ACTN|nr:hypothetical protein [Streptomyces resistomycificus]KOG34002.1 lipoprotein [Streptomyces resistomycificus]KUN96507.1 hypothetical protein AQJ84_19210 [Streptomyces resistomycificus]